MKYYIEKRSDKDALLIHVDERLVKGAPILIDDLDEDKETIKREAVSPENLECFCEAVFNIEGTEMLIAFSRYSIELNKAILFSWGEILPHVLDALGFFLAKDAVLKRSRPGSGSGHRGPRKKPVMGSMQR